MNKIVALSAVATIPTAAPALPAVTDTDPTAPALPAPTAKPHPDAALLELGREFERLLAVEKSLKKELDRLNDAVERIRCETMGFGEDRKACWNAAADDRLAEWNQAWEAAAARLGYHGAWKAWNRASEKTGRLGKKILKQKPMTAAGLLVRARVIETHDEICQSESPEQLIKEIRSFAKRANVA